MLIQRQRGRRTVSATAPFDQRASITSISGGVESLYEPEAVTLFTAMDAVGTDPVTSRKTLINTLITSLKSAGIWAKLDRLYVLAAHESSAALIDWKNPGTDTLTINSAMPFTADRGFTGDSVADFLSGATAFNAFTQFQQNSGHIAGWTWKAAQDLQPIAATATASETAINSRNTADQIRVRANATATTAISNTHGFGFYMSNRAGAANQRGYKNSVTPGDSADASVAPSTSVLSVCKYNTTSFSAHEVGLVSVGASLQAEAVDYNTAVWNYMKGVQDGFQSSSSYAASGNGRAWQGCATDGTNVWLFSDRLEQVPAYTYSNNIDTFTVGGSLVDTDTAYYTATTGGLLWNCVDGTYYNGNLYICCTNWHSNGGAETACQILVVDPTNNFSVVTTYPLTTHVGSIESIARRGTEWWVCWSGSADIRRYNDDFSSIVGTYTATPPTGYPYGTAGTEYYQGLEWIGDHLFASLHGANTTAENVYAPGVCVFQWTGAALNRVATYIPPTYGSGQGMCRNGADFFFADRPGIALVKSTLLDYAAY